MNDRYQRLDGNGLRQGWWRRSWSAVSAWVRGDRSVDSPINVEVHGDWDSFSFITPAMGEAFDFSVELRCDWCATGTASGHRTVAEVESDLRRHIAEVRADARYSLEAGIRETARRFLPHRPGDVERALSAEASTCFSDGDITCSATARVSVVEAVRKQLERYTFERIALDQKLETTKHLIDVTRQLRDAWRGFLDEGLQQLELPGPLRRQAWMAPYAVQLAEQPRDVAAVLRAMLYERLDHGDELFKRLGGMVQDGQHLDVYDFLLQSDIALRATLEGLGVPVPPLQHSDPFGGESAPDAEVVDVTDPKQGPGSGWGTASGAPAQPG